MRERGPFVYLPQALARYRSLPFVDRMEKYAPGFVTFSRLVRDRYGEAGNRAILQRAEMSSHLLVETGMRAIATGQMKQARRALLCATRYKDPDWQTRLRLLRAYMPGSLALVLTSRRRRMRAKVWAGADHLNSD